MASNIGTASTFAFANMKPASGEQIDALWGQNVADNTGLLRTREAWFGHQGIQLSYATTGGVSTTLINEKIFLMGVIRPRGHNRLRGTMRVDTNWGTASADDPDIYGTHGIIFYGNLGTYSNLVGTSDNNIGSPHTWGSNLSFDLAIGSYLSEGSLGTLAVYLSATSHDSSVSRSITQYFSTPLNLWSAWDGT